MCARLTLQAQPNWNRRPSIMYTFDCYIKSNSCNLFVDSCLHIRTYYVYNEWSFTWHRIKCVYHVFQLTASQNKNLSTCKLQITLHMWMHSDEWRKKANQSNRRRNETESKQTKTIRWNYLCVLCNSMCSYHWREGAIHLGFSLVQIVRKQCRVHVTYNKRRYNPIIVFSVRIFIPEFSFSYIPWAHSNNHFI